MNTIEQLNNSKIPIIILDKKLEQFRSKTLFPDKLVKANELLEKVGIPIVPTKSTTPIFFENHPFNLEGDLYFPFQVRRGWITK